MVSTKIMEVFKTNGDIFTLFRNNNLDMSNCNALTDLITTSLNVELSTSAAKALKYKISNFFKHLKSRWIASKYNYKTFCTMNSEWLNKTFIWPQEVIDSVSYLSSSHTSSNTITPNTSKAFENLSERHKRKKTQEMRNNPQMLDFIVKKKLKSDAAHFIYDFIQNHPEHMEKVKQFCEQLLDGAGLVDKETALSVYVSAKLTRTQYNVIRDVTQYKSRALPSYYEIQKAKEDCLPKKASITISDTGVQVSLQSLLDHTALRFIKLLRSDLEPFMDLTMISKWGCDDASDQARYKLSFDDESNDDSSVLICSLVPIKIYNNSNKEILWQNNCPSSTRFCRPIQFQFVKEDKNTVKSCVDHIENQISSLKLTSLEDISIKHQLILTMIDNKICNILTETKSAMRCYLCGASPKDMNNLDIVEEKKINEEYLSFGISSLHCWIRCFECLLHISYRLNIKIWAVKNEKHKREVEERKKALQAAFRDKMGLLIDVVKQGKGTSNDGNTARKFFADPQLTADITGLDKNLITRFSVILQTIASGEQIDVGKFQAHTCETAKLYVSLYPWYHMPASVHKLLIHGSTIIKHAIVPIGQLSEDAQEANHKYFRKYRENHSRRMSRKANNEDVFRNLLIASDPIISSSIQIIKHEKKELCDNAKNLLEL